MRRLTICSTEALLVLVSLSPAPGPSHSAWLRQESAELSCATAQQPGENDEGVEQTRPAVRSFFLQAPLPPHPPPASDVQMR